MIRRAVLAAALALVPAPALAEAVDPAALAAARELMTASDIQNQMKALGPALAQASATQMKDMFGENAIPEGLRAQFGAATAEFIGSLGDAFTPAVQDEMAAVYARHFDLGDLRHLVVLMKDPAMVRLRAATPAITAELIPVTLAAMKPLQTAYIARIKGIVRNWIASHPDDKAKLRSPDVL